MTTKVGAVNGVSVHAGTVPGAAYVNKVTHPPSPMSSDYQGRPDCSAPNVVLMELKSEVNIPPILTFPTSASAVKTVNPSSLLFVQTSGAVVMNYIFMWLADSASSVSGWVQPQGQTAVATTQPAVTQNAPCSANSSGYNFNSWQTDIASHRKTYKSSTYYLNATNFNNQGIVTSAKFKPDIVSGSSLLTLFEQHKGDRASASSLLSAVKAACRDRGLSFKFNESDFVIVDKDGVSIPGEQMAYQIWEYGNFDTNRGDALPFSNQIYYNTLFPATSSDLLVSSPKAATRPAREGAFVVQQQEDEVIPWVSNYTTSATTPATPTGLNLSFIRYLRGQTAVYIPLYNRQINGAAFSPATAEVPWSSLDWSFTLFEGLTVPTTVGTSLTSVPYVTAKSFLGLELQPRSSSSLVTFQRTLPLPDADAIRMAIGIMHARPDSLPAAANDLGSIAMTAMRYIPTAVEWLKNIFGGKNSKTENKTEEKKVVKKTKPAAGRKPKLSRVAQASRRNLDSALAAKVAGLTSAVNRMQVAARQQSAPATQLPKYENQQPLPRRNNKKRPAQPAKYNPQPGMSLRQYLQTKQ